MTHFPHGTKGTKKKLLQEAVSANRQMGKAMAEASRALDIQTKELQSLRRIVISERAQVIFYSEKYVSCLRNECIDLSPQNFLDLPEEQQETYIKQAIKELFQTAESMVPHDSKALQTEEVPIPTVAKKIILPN